MFLNSFFRFTIIVSHVFIAVSLCDVRLSHLSKYYSLTYLLTCLLVVVLRQLVVLMDPTDETDDVLRQNRSREKQFMFDLSLDGQTPQVHLLSSTLDIYTVNHKKVAEHL